MTSEPVHIRAPGGEVILPSENDQKAYDLYRFATARRAGDTLYVSGVVVGRGPGEGNDAAAFKDQVRRAFRRIQATLHAAGVDFGEVAMINSFHIWNTPHFAGTRMEQFEAFGAVKDEFMARPYPAWTAVGTTELLPDTGIVEIQMIAHLSSR